MLLILTMLSLKRKTKKEHELKMTPNTMIGTGVHEMTLMIQKMASFLSTEIGSTVVVVALPNSILIVDMLS